MAAENEVKLNGMWASPYVKRVELALKVKGIPYEYIEENLMNKSHQLLEYNPVHKKVPVLIHNGKPIVESLVILEYIDETWTGTPRLMPEDPYQRAQLRFWGAYFEPLFEKMRMTWATEGEAQQKAINEVKVSLDVAETGLKQVCPNGIPLFIENGGIPGYLDIILYSLLGTYKVAKEVLGIQFFEEERFPLLFYWITSLSELAIVKEITPPHDQLVGFVKFLQQSYRQQPPSAA